MDNILFITLRADFGGGPEHLWQLLKHMPDGISAFVACPREYPYYERYCECLGADRIFELPHRKFSVIKLWQLLKFCQKHHIQITHSHGKGAGLYARLLGMLTGLPNVHTFHGVHTGEYGWFGGKAYTFAEALLSRFSNIGIAVSKGELEQIESAKLIAAEKLILVENGVHIPDETIATKACAPHPIVSISRFDYAKNSEFIIDIMENLYQRAVLNKFTFIIVGDGPGKIQIESMAKKFGTTLQCVGASLHPHSFFTGALCYLSTSRWEGMPLAVLEAMAHGLPAVVSDVVGNRDVVENGKTGLLYKPGNAKEAAEAIIRLADEPELCRRMSKEARNHTILNYDVRDMALKTFDVLRTISS